MLVRAESCLDALKGASDAVTVHRHDGSTAQLVDILAQARPDTVFHLAAAFVAEHVPGDIDRLVHANLLFATQLLEAMRVNGVRLLVNTGTAWQHYGNRDYDPVNLYAATKQAFEAILAYYVNAHGFIAATLALFDTYGPGDERPKLMRALWRAAREGRPLAMSSGRQLLDLVYVDDVVDAYLAAESALREGGAGHRHYGVSSGAPLPLARRRRRGLRTSRRRVARRALGRTRRPRARGAGSVDGIRGAAGMARASRISGGNKAQ
ncbi:NAD-dependent epimerase/dehydratase family protein [Massilia sp. Se16.2.3]|uniref:NAD-dependent epimerase/dehydratase family protein n=1 Tax=Massilia sp. Se16.2.3 TaxID=2709303 RepID=UPI0015FFB307|nr:NAD-dependent epimerase/dehydratase family protein [Massilia sp. Se16.2.3]QNA99127.1 NAD-dependent epimerase/dehydratase family protein [Massilia sp. Se16.2.3]